MQEPISGAPAKGALAVQKLTTPTEEENEQNTIIYNKLLFKSGALTSSAITPGAAGPEIAVSNAVFAVSGIVLRSMPKPSRLSYGLCWPMHPVAQTPMLPLIPSGPASLLDPPVC